MCPASRIVTARSPGCQPHRGGRPGTSPPTAPRTILTAGERIPFTTAHSSARVSRPRRGVDRRSPGLGRPSVGGVARSETGHNAGGPKLLAPHPSILPVPFDAPRPFWYLERISLVVCPSRAYGCHGWLAQPCVRHCWASQQWHPTRKVEMDRLLVPLIPSSPQPLNPLAL
jgi:hypothetical protein